MGKRVSDPSGDDHQAPPNAKRPHVEKMIFILEDAENMKYTIKYWEEDMKRRPDSTTWKQNDYSLAILKNCVSLECNSIVSKKLSANSVFKRDESCPQVEYRSVQSFIRACNRGEREGNEGVGYQPDSSSHLPVGKFDPNYGGGYQQRGLWDVGTHAKHVGIIGIFANGELDPETLERAVPLQVHGVGRGDIELKESEKQIKKVGSRAREDFIKITTLPFVV